MQMNVLYYIHRHRVTGWVRCVGILQGSVFAPRLSRRYFLFFIPFLCSMIWNEKGAQIYYFPFAVYPLINADECDILHSSAPGNRLGEMSWHLAGQCVCTTTVRRFFLLSLLYSLFMGKSSSFCKNIAVFALKIF